MKSWCGSCRTFHNGVCPKVMAMLLLLGVLIGIALLGAARALVN